MTNQPTNKVSEGDEALVKAIVDYILLGRSAHAIKTVVCARHRPKRRKRSSIR